MFPDELVRIATALVTHVRNHTEAEGLATLYSPDAVSVEGAEMPGGGAEVRGLEGIRAKHAWWNEHHEVHEAGLDGPFLCAPDSFAVLYTAEVSNRATGERISMKEIGVYTIADGRIVREAFHYAL